MMKRAQLYDEMIISASIGFILKSDSFKTMFLIIFQLKLSIFIRNLIKIDLFSIKVGIFLIFDPFYLFYE